MDPNVSKWRSKTFVNASGIRAPSIGIEKLLSYAISGLRGVFNPVRRSLVSAVEQVWHLQEAEGREEANEIDDPE